MKQKSRTIVGLIVSLLVSLAVVLTSNTVLAASARCEVVGKKGNVLIMDCGDQSKDFKEKSQVKIKTDRDKK